MRLVDTRSSLSVSPVRAIVARGKFFAGCRLAVIFHFRCVLDKIRRTMRSFSFNLLLMTCNIFSVFKYIQV